MSHDTSSKKKPSDDVMLLCGRDARSGEVYGLRRRGGRRLGPRLEAQSTPRRAHAAADHGADLGLPAPRTGHAFALRDPGLRPLEGNFRSFGQDLGYDIEVQLPHAANGDLPVAVIDAQGRIVDGELA